MGISKRFSNTGKSGNHGMQEVDMLKRKMIEDKFEQEGLKLTTTCGNGCEFTHIDESISLRESIILGDFIQYNNLCPFCRVKEGSIDFKFCAENQNKMQEFSFVMNDIRYETIYKPAGYRFLPPEESEEE